MRRLAFALTALFAAVASFAADVPAEVALSEPKLLVSHVYPRIAVGITRRYAVWSDSPYIYGMELTADGKARLETRTVLTTGRTILQLLAAGDQFYLVYTDDGASADAWKDVYVRSLETGKTVKYPGYYNILLLWNGSRLLARYGASGAWFGFLLDRDLVQVGPVLTLDLPGPYWATGGAANGTFFLVGSADRDGNGAHAILVDNDGKITKVPMGVLGTFMNPQIATNGSEYLLVWQPTTTSLVAQHLSLKGERIGDLMLMSRVDAQRLDWPTVAWSGGSDYFVGWIDSSTSTWQLFLRRISGMTASAPERIAAPSNLGYLSGGPAGVFLEWSVDLRPNNGVWAASPAYVKRLDVDDEADIVSYAVASQTNPAVATDGMQTAVVWLEDQRLRFGRFDSRGEPLDGDGIDVVTDDVRIISPAIATNGVDYLIAWSSQWQVFGRFVGRDGRFRGGAFAISAPLPRVWPEVSVNVAWTSSQFVVLWDGQGYGGAFITPGGTAAPFGYSIGTGTAGLGWFSGSPRPLVVSTRSMYNASFVSATFLGDGTTVDIVREPMFSQPNRILLSNVRVATNGRDYLLTWNRTNDTTHFSEAWMARIDGSGKLIDAPIVVVNDARGAAYAQAIPLFDGADYRVVVHGGTSSVSEAAVNDRTFSCGCLDFIVMPFGAGATDVSATLAAAAAGTGQLAIAYQRTVLDPFTAMRSRVFLRLLGFTTPRRRAAGR